MGFLPLSWVLWNFVSLHGVLSPVKSLEHKIVQMLKWTLKYCILNRHGSLEIGHKWASGHNSHFFLCLPSICPFSGVLPKLPLGDLLLPFSVYIFQVEMHWSGLSRFKSISRSVKNHEGSEIVFYVWEIKKACYHIMDADREHKIIRQKHRHKCIILSRSSHQSVSIFSLVSQVSIPQGDKKGHMTSAHVVGCVKADELTTEGPEHLSKQRTICQQYVSLFTLVPLMQAIVKLWGSDLLSYLWTSYRAVQEKEKNK